MATILPMEKTKDSVAFGQRLKQARQRRRLSQKELAALVNLHPRQVSKYEMGTSFPTVAKLFELIRVLKARPEELLADVEVDASKPVHNIRLFQRFQDVETLPRQDQETVISLVDAMIAKGKIRKIVG